jgi:putative flippase GtrA
MKDVGFMQRPERIVALGVGVAFAPVVQAVFFATEARPSYHLTIAVLCLLAVTAHATAIQRLAHLLGALGGLAAGGLKAFRHSPRAIIVSSIATGSDYLCTHSLVSIHALSPPFATVVGCVLGGIIAFLLSRNWAFDAKRGPVLTQAARYVFVSGTTALLNAGGVALALLVPDTDYRVGWVITRAVVFITWSFPLLNDFAFPPSERDSDSERWTPVTPATFGLTPSPVAATVNAGRPARERIRSSPTAARSPSGEHRVKAAR